MRDDISKRKSKLVSHMLSWAMHLLYYEDLHSSPNKYRTNLVGREIACTAAFIDHYDIMPKTKLIDKWTTDSKLESLRLKKIGVIRQREFLSKLKCLLYLEICRINNRFAILPAIDELEELNDKICKVVPVGQMTLMAVYFEWNKSYLEFVKTTPALSEMQVYKQIEEVFRLEKLAAVLLD